MFIRFTELMATVFTPASGAYTWTDWDLTALGVPGNCVVEVLIYYTGTGAALENSVGIRENGSALNRRATLSPYDTSQQMVTMRCNVDADGVIERLTSYLAAVPYASFKVIGYYTGATYTELFTLLNDADGVWTATDLFSVASVPKGAVVDILAANSTDTVRQAIGVRSPGETGRTFNLDKVRYAYGWNCLTVFDKTDTTDGEIEIFCDDASECMAYCMGYWDSTVDCTVLNQHLTTTPASTWNDKDLDAFSVPTNVVGSLMMYNFEHGVANQAGVRKDGSALDRRRSIDEGDLILGVAYTFTMSMSVQISGADSRIEIYSQDITYVYHYLDSYLFTVGPRMAKINGVSLSDVDKINGVSLSDIIAINGRPV